MTVFFLLFVNLILIVPLRKNTPCIPNLSCQALDFEEPTKSIQEGDVGACPDELQVLRDENRNLKMQQHAQLEELESLRKQLSDLQLTASENDHDEPDGIGLDGEDGSGLTSEAVRKRLWRICKPRANGKPCHTGLICHTNTF